MGRVVGRPAALAALGGGRCGLGVAAVAAELTGVGGAAAAYPAAGCGCRGRLGAAAVGAEFAGVAGLAAAAGPACGSGCRGRGGLCGGLLLGAHLVQSLCVHAARRTGHIHAHKGHGGACALIAGCGLQTLTDLEQALHSPGGGMQLRDEAARIYAFPDGTVYHFAVRPVQDKYGIPYTEVMATDVSRLAALHAALQQENERLADANRRAKRLYDNMPDIVREEEILKMKMRVHDDIGHTLLAARRALRHEHDLARIKSETAEWESSISLLCRARQEDAAEDPLTCMQRRAAVLGAAVQLRGAYPAARATRELYALILRECTSNAVRHAGATELYADSEHRSQAWHLCITNNGAPPKAEIKEGGGLSSLRRRIEKAGGTVTVHSLPVFVLEVTLPDKESIYDTRYDR